MCNAIRSKRIALFLAVLLGWVVSEGPPVRAEVRRVEYASGSRLLVVEVLDDDLLHFAWLTSEAGKADHSPLPTTPMVLKLDHSGPSEFSDDGLGTLRTADLLIEVDLQSLCLTLTDTARDCGLLLTTLCPLTQVGKPQGMTIAPQGFTHAYGLGEQFTTAGSADGDWSGRIRSPGNQFGNAMQPWNDGVVGNAQFPIAYFLGEGSAAYAIFVDDVYAQTWNLASDPWRIAVPGAAPCYYLFSGPNLRALRADYMELTGRPPVPPKQAFGLWISEYGFDNWAELEDKLRTLRASGFPVDGFVLDLQWFGGIAENSDDSRMGSLSWDEANFTDPAVKIVELWESAGLGIMTVEEPYVAKNLPEHAKLERQGYLVRDCESCQSTYLLSNPWWGKGGMLDWTNDAAGRFWHDWKREPLIQLGVVGHWTDLGEPELYNANAWYWGVGLDGDGLHSQKDVHNLYNLKWSESIHAGYARNGHAQRPFILSRSGTSGSQRYGVSMWSGDIASNLSSLAAQLNVQMHMSLSGVDYFGSDIGGFYRNALHGDLDELYTQWLADGLAFDIPVRVHTNNLCNCHETAPDRVGDVQSNLDNVRQRYELTPYLYSLAHRAYLYGEAVAPPLVYWYPEDPHARTMGSEKLLGRDLLVAAVAEEGGLQRSVYLPAGVWIDYHTHTWYHSQRQSIGALNAYPDGKFRLPMFARAGAILPLMHVDDKTMNILGKRSDGSTRDELILRVFASQSPSEFTLYEDDGQTVAYQQGELRTTLITQHQQDGRVEVTVGAASGTYAAAPAARDNVVELIVEASSGARAVALNGSALTQFSSQSEFEAAESGWGNAGLNRILAKSGRVDVGQSKTFEFELGQGVQPSQMWQPGSIEAEQQAPPAPLPRVSLWRWFAVLAACVALIAASLWVGRRQARRGNPGNPGPGQPADHA